MVRLASAADGLKYDGFKGRPSTPQVDVNPVIKNAHSPLQWYLRTKSSKERKKLRVSRGETLECVPSLFRGKNFGRRGEDEAGAHGVELRRARGTAGSNRRTIMLAHGGGTSPERERGKARRLCIRG